MSPHVPEDRRHFPVILEQDEDGVYIASCPMFRGCRSYGATVDEALENVREAIELCLEDESFEDSNRFVGVHELEIVQGA